MKKKDTIQLYITGALVIILVVFIVRGIMAGKKQQEDLKSKQGSSREQVINGEEDKNKGLFARLMKETEKLEVARDPFSKERRVILVGPRLTGISWDEKNPQAIINGRIVGIGSEISGNIVVDIQKDKVILSTGIADFELRIGE